MEYHFPSATDMMNAFQKNPNLGYLVEKGCMEQVCKYVANQTVSRGFLGLAVELMFIDCAKVFKDMPPKTLDVIRFTVTDTLLDIATCPQNESRCTY